jgi:dTDP-glucose 4,6-dehydratase
MTWSGRTVLVTGAGGFIGSHLAERLVALGARTRALVRYTSSGSWGWLDRSPVKDEIEVIAGDIRDPDSFREAVRGTDVVFHLAALIGIPYSYDAPLSYVRTNVEGSLHLFQAALEAGVKRVVHTSTSEVYGNAQRVPIDEGHPLSAQSPYAASKIGADQLALSFHRSYGLPVTVVRPFNTFGPRQSARAVVPTIISQCLAEGNIALGSTHTTRDLNYVGNTVDGYLKAAEAAKAAGRTINLGTGRETRIEDLARMIASLTGRPCEMVRDEARVRPGQSEVDRLVADITAARTLLGWEPAVTLEEGLTLTIEWMRAHLDEYRTGVYAR